MTKKQPTNKTKKQKQELVRQNIKYKVAFLTNVDVDDEILFSALVLN